MWSERARIRRAALIVASLAMVTGTVAPASGNASALPDGRQWELVSPPNLNGAAISAFEREGGVAQAAAEGGAFTWAASTPVGAEPAGNRAPEWSQALSMRGAGGWSSRDIAGPHEAATGLETADFSEYMLFSPNISLGLLEPKGETPLSPEATEKTIYLRDLGEGMSPTGDYVPLVTAANVPAGTKFGGDGAANDAPEFRGASPDLSHVVFSSPEALTPKALAGENLYEWAGGQLQLVSALPKGEGGAAATTPVLGLSTSMSRDAISHDGSRIIWSNNTTGQGGHLYMSDTAKGETIRLDVAQGARQPAQATARFQTASADGDKVFFTDNQKLTADSTASVEGPDLYVFEATNDEDEPLQGTLTDLTVDGNAGESADVQGLLPGASEDGSYIYLVAKGVLGNAENASHEKAEPGADNLYVVHETGTEWSPAAFTTKFIAQLSSGDGADWAERGLEGQGHLSELTSRVSPDGRYLAFMSDRELTGYDNQDVNSGAADEEVFLYDAASGQLLCASCDPSGARPVGIRDIQDEVIRTTAGGTIQGETLVDHAGIWKGRWLAGNIPGWTPASSSQAFYQSRYLSDSGRLFFNSSDALAPQDENRTEDVYEYEPLGVGGCDGAGASSGSVVFKPAHTVEVAGGQGEEPAGCVGLISSGASTEESVFLDADENGGEVFFLTAAKLAPQDYDTGFDVYDAHECTAQSPCTTPLAETPPPCTTPEACRAPLAPQPAIFGAPSSQTFSGPANPSPVPATASQTKASTRAQKLAKALKACMRRPRKKRPACKSRAHRRYGAPKAKVRTKRAPGGRRRA